MLHVLKVSVIGLFVLQICLQKFSELVTYLADVSDISNINFRDCDVLFR